jgi:serine O-acetyltransferase
VVGVPGRVVQRKGESSPLDHSRVPDPEGDVIRSLVDRVAHLEQQHLEQQQANQINNLVNRVAIDYDLLAAVRPKHFPGNNHDAEDQPKDQLDGFIEGAGI